MEVLDLLVSLACLSVVVLAQQQTPPPAEHQRNVLKDRNQVHDQA